MQADINTLVTRERGSNKKNILMRKNVLELAFEDISTFDAERSIAGSLLWGLDGGKN